MPVPSSPPCSPEKKHSGSSLDLEDNRSAPGTRFRPHPLHALRDQGLSPASSSCLWSSTSTFRELILSCRLSPAEQGLELRTLSSAPSPPLPRTRSQPSSPLEVRAWSSAFVLEVMLSRVALRVPRSLLNWESDERDRMIRTKVAQSPLGSTKLALRTQSSTLGHRAPWGRHRCYPVLHMSKLRLRR